MSGNARKVISHGAGCRADALESTVDQPKISADVLLSAMEQAIDPMVVIDEHNNIILFNAAAERIWGLPRTDVMGRNVSCLVPQAERAQHDSYIDRNRETGIGRIVGTSREVEFTRANGEYVCGELSISRVQLADSHKIYYIAVMKDVTEQSRQRKILILQNDVLQALAADLTVQEMGDLLCRRVDGFVPGGVAAFMLLDRSRRGLSIVASPGMPTGTVRPWTAWN